MSWSISSRFSGGRGNDRMQYLAGGFPHWAAEPSAPPGQSMGSVLALPIVFELYFTPIQKTTDGGHGAAVAAQKLDGGDAVVDGSEAVLQSLERLRAADHVASIEALEQL